ncbi:MAG: VOC family protein [Planctomycetes bacterium]|nr:VOC family protein [Planctomycetota bacterium]
MAIGTRRIHDFCWVNLLTPRPTEARAFFGEVLGWSYAEIPGIGHLVQVEGRAIGGIFDLEAPNTPKGTPPTLGVMLKVASADATVARVAKLGGRALPAFDIGDGGRMAVCFDPNGAEFDVWEPRKNHGTDVDSRLHGAPSWFETLTSDVDRAAKFYTELFGWSATPIPGPALAYTVFELDGAPIAGMLALGPKMVDLRPHWRTYFTVSDADAAVGRALELGATIAMSLKDAPGGARFGELTSPQGVSFGISQLAR